MSETILANVIDVLGRRIQPARVHVADGRVAAIEPMTDAEPSTFLLPGFVDAHVHVESSMLTPPNFAREVVRHGTVATVSDPHEIANVLGVEGVRYMLDAADGVSLKIVFGAPSCVPATPFETAGGTLDLAAVEALLDDPRIGYLSEMMNYPGVLSGDEDVLAKIAAARRRGKPVDGHAPGLRGEDARRYVAAGISTDHECFSKAEAKEKLAAGAKILIREGSAARNFEALHTLIDEHPDDCMFCTDDIHPDDLVQGHIDAIVRRAIERGLSLMNVLRVACVNPVLHYGLNVGLLRAGDPADFIEVDDLTKWNVLRTWVDGELVAERGESRLPLVRGTTPNRFAERRISREELRCTVPAGAERIRVIGAVDGELITRDEVDLPRVEGGEAVAEPSRDLLKLVVVNRYADTPAAVAFVRGIGLGEGAIASSVAHDSHNVIAVGADDAALARAVNAVMEARGGLATCRGSDVMTLPLPVAGLMSQEPCELVAERYTRLDAEAHALGSPLRAPFMTLSFLALLVIPELKLSDLGLFDGGRFQLVSLFPD